jgi:hypothetical protein
MLFGHTDNYYYQLASWVRRFKGVRPRHGAPSAAKISIDGDFKDWQSITPEFRDTKGDVTHRDHKGYGDVLYRNNTGRNDFVLAKAAYDRRNLYFFVQTRDKITPRTDRYWMLLLLDSDRSTSTGWLGYDYVANLEVTGEKSTTIKAWNSGQWQTVGKADYRRNRNGMELAILRKLVGQSAGSVPRLDFHWADNIQSFNGVEELGVNGDNAPNRRWNYRYGPE